MAQEKPSGIAFFDFDKTIITVDSGPRYGWHIYKDRVAGALPSFRALFYGIGFKMGLVKRRSVAKFGVAAYKGIPRDVLTKWMKEAYPRLIQPHLSKTVVDRMKQHQAEGFHVVVISASPPFFLQEAADDLGMDAVFGSELGFENEVCTGKYTGKYLAGPVKADIARDYAAAQGLTLDDCYFY
ncbi:MAG: HAD family hydrolase, partial [Bacteroidota bacterium]